MGRFFKTHLSQVTALPQDGRFIRMLKGSTLMKALFYHGSGILALENKPKSVQLNLDQLWSGNSTKEADHVLLL